MNIKKSNSFLPKNKDVNKDIGATSKFLPFVKIFTIHLPKVNIKIPSAMLNTENTDSLLLLHK